MVMVVVKTSNVDSHGGEHCEDCNEEEEEDVMVGNIR